MAAVAGAAVQLATASAAPAETQPAAAYRIITAGPDGAPGNNSSAVITVSRNLRYVLIQSQANNLVPAAHNEPYSVHTYVADTEAGTLAQVDLTADGTGLPEGSFSRGMSDDGRYVVYAHAPPSGGTFVELVDRAVGTSVRLCGRSDCGWVSFSPDGRYLAFAAYNDTGSLPGPFGERHVYVYELATRAMTVVDPGTPNGRCAAYNPQFGAGGWLYWASCRTDLVPGAGGQHSNLFRRNLHTGQVEVVDTTPAGVPADRDVNGFNVSADGHYVAFDSQAVNLVPGDADGQWRPYLKDLQTGALVPVARRNSGAAYVTGVGALYQTYGGFTADNSLVICSQDPQLVPQGPGAVLRHPDGTMKWIGRACVNRVSPDATRFVATTTQLPDGTSVVGQQVLLAAVPTVPAAPAVSTVVVGSHSATITWLKPADGGLSITGYTVTASPGGQSCSTASADALFCTITDLTNGVNYTFTVTARNALGTSPPPSDGGGSGGSTGSGTPGTPPAPVGGVEQTRDPDGTQVTLRWLAAASELPVTGYRATAEPGGQTCTTTGELSCTITGLSPGTDYAFTVVAINAAGPSGPSEPVTSPADTTAPTVTPTYDRAPVPIEGTDWFDGPIAVTWHVADNAGGSGVPPANVPAPVTAAASGAVSSGPVCDAAGNCTTATVDVRIDADGPAVTIGGVTPDGRYLLGTGPTATCAATDTGSGLTGPCTVTTSGGNANGVGTFTVTATATDRVGHVTTTTVGYRIVYRWNGFTQPIDDPAGEPGATVSTFKAGSTVPVKFALTGPNGQVVTPVAAPVWLVPARGAAATLPIDESVFDLPGDSGSSFRRADAEWQYNWKTDKQQAGYYWRLGVRLDDGEVHTVDIALR